MSYEIMVGGYRVVLPEVNGDSGLSVGPLDAFSYWCPRGVHPGIMRVLLTGADLDGIDTDSSVDLQIRSTAEIEADPPEDGFLLGPFYFHSARKLGPGAAGDNSVYLCEFRDWRELGRLQFVEKVAINCHQQGTYSPDDDEIYESSTATSASVGKSWQDVIDDLWPSVFGTAPTLPYTPSSVPHDIQFYGVNPWLEALPFVFKRLGIDLKYDPRHDDIRSSDPRFSLVQIGESQSDLSVISGVTPVYEGDAEMGPMVLPATLKLCFWNHFSTLGNVYSAPPFHVASESITGGLTGTTKVIWMDTKRRMEDDGSTVENATEISDATDEVKDALEADGGVTVRLEKYSGPLMIFPGSELTAVKWHNTGAGVATTIIGHPGDPVNPIKTGCMVPMDGNSLLAPVRFDADGSAAAIYGDRLGGPKILERGVTDADQIEGTTDSSVTTGNSVSVTNLHNSTTYTAYWDRRVPSGRTLASGASVRIAKEVNDPDDYWHIILWACEDESVT